jgi:hypothetical protein
VSKQIFSSSVIFANNTEYSLILCFSFLLLIVKPAQKFTIILYIPLLFPAVLPFFSSYEETGKKLVNIKCLLAKVLLVPSNESELTFFLLVYRSFAFYNRVHRDINYYIEPKILTEKLKKFLLEGKFCLLYGHHQSGKSTTAYAIKDWLEENSDKEIYITTFSNGIVIDEGLDIFWHSVCSKMASLDASRFKYNINDTAAASSSTFKGFFSKYNYPSEKDCIIIIDEASHLSNCNSKIIKSFISSLRALKDGRGQYNAYSFLLVGTDVIRDFLIQYQRPDFEDPGSNISPFSDEASLASTRFTSREIEQLLEQFSSENNYILDISSIAFDIYSITLGHKGLVGLCCSYLEGNVMANMCELKFNDWRCKTCNLPEFIRGETTCENIIRTLHYLSFDQKNILMEVLHFGYDVVSMVSTLLIGCHIQFII